MRLLLVIVLAALASVTPAADDVASAERAFERAVVAGQHDAVAQWLHDEFFSVDGGGASHARAEFLATLEPADGSLSDVEVHTAGAAAVVLGTVRRGDDAQRFTHLWIQAPGGWRIVASQVTNIVANPPRPPLASAPSPLDETSFIKDLTAQSDEQRAVVDAFRLLQKAEHAPDWRGFAVLTADEFHVVGVQGQVGSKPQRVEAIRQQVDPTPFPIVRDLRVRVFGNAAVMTAIQEPARQAALRFTRLWVKNGSVWQQLVNHQTMVQPRSDR